MSMLEGQLQHISYRHPESHYTVAKVRLTEAAAARMVTVVGYMVGVHPGEMLKLHGDWQTHPRFGTQFRVEAYEVGLPASVEGIRSYLKSGVVKGLGPSLADRLVRRFGARTLAIIEQTPEKLCQVEGIGQKLAMRIAAAWRTAHLLHELTALLQRGGLNAALAPKLWHKYGEQVLSLVRENPYRLLQDLPEVGFAQVDTLAQGLGQPLDGSERLQAGLNYLLYQAAQDGHVFVLQKQLLAQGQKLLQTSSTELGRVLDQLTARGELIRETEESGSQGGIENRIFLAVLHRAEIALAGRLRVLLSLPGKDPGARSINVILSELQKQLALVLSAEQRSVLEQIDCHRIAVITGGPGTGKTTLIKALCGRYQSLSKRLLLAAPTGRAAKRLSEVTGQPATTIHRLLGVAFDAQRFRHHQDRPLPADTVIIDEASMIDVQLMHDLLSALRLNTNLILVGDRFQLPAVGPGNVLADLIQSQQVPVFSLQTVFRQAHESLIVKNAHRVLQGQWPHAPDTLDDGPRADFYFIEEQDPQRIVARIAELCTRIIPEQFSLDPIKDIQVLTPMHKGPVGTLQLNQALQPALNRSTVPAIASAGRFMPGDKVMHLKNDYTKEVFNGDIGRVEAVESDQRRLWVDYDGRGVSYGFEECHDLSLAYAISVHKAQGSEYPAVVMPLVTQHYALLQRNLLYTAITRGKRLVVLIGSSKALALALKRDKPAARRTRLAARLQAR